MLLMAAVHASAQVKTDIREFNLSGPFPVVQPYAADTVDVNGKKFDTLSQLQAVSLSAPPTTTFGKAVLPSLADSRSVGLLTFYVNNTDYLKGKIEVKGPKQYKLYIDEQESTGDLKLAPDHHTFAIRYLAEAGAGDSLSVTIDANKSVAYTLSTRHPYMVHDLLEGKRVKEISLSADGQLVSLAYQTTMRGGESRWTYEVRDTKTGRLVAQPSQAPQWLPKSIAWTEEAQEGGKHILYKVEPRTGERVALASDLPEGRYVMSPTEDYLILIQKEDGPKEDKDVFEVLEMDDRQPGWRSRTYLSRYDLRTGVTQRITFGNKGEYLSDISQDGRKLLVMSSRSRLIKRPTTVTDVFLIDARTLSVDTLMVGAEFLNRGLFSPDGSQILFAGTSEAFGRIGCQLPSDVTPSMAETELFLYQTASHQVTPLTKDFDPSVEMWDWSWADGLIYLSVVERDCQFLYVLNPKTGKISKLPAKGEMVTDCQLARRAPMLAYISNKVLEPSSAYVMDLAPVKKSQVAGLRSTTFFDGATVLGDAEVGTCQDWNYTNAKGETVYGRLYLPKDFDASKKYPMIVDYYGGCVPSGRSFESRYPAQYWTSLGYVAYVVQPSGATGFGQEWASRHVNTAGEGPAEDIIEGVKRICAEHTFIDSKHVGCIGASYGGFMTMYLQTITDIFAAAISHAGIANHTSYWGEGYWGYNYSEVSMANSYPWSHRKLYVDQSPLFNADKIHTPLLLLHGNADTNVPIVESLQMFTALKLLGREVSLVEVEGQNHHIMDYTKRQKWMATQMAWFARWLKEDPTWWDALYPKKNL